MLSRHNVGTYQGNELTHNSFWNARSQSSQLAEPLWLILAERVELVPSPSCGQHAFKSLRTFKSSRSPFDKRRLIWLVVWKQFVLYNGNCDFFKIEEKDLILLSLIRPSGDHRRPTAHS